MRIVNSLLAARKKTAGDNKESFSATVVDAGPHDALSDLARLLITNSATFGACFGRAHHKDGCLYSNANDDPKCQQTNKVQFMYGLVSCTGESLIAMKACRSKVESGVMLPESR